MRRQWDAIVVGAGGSGLAAAVSAAEQGLQVLLLEKQPQPGGTTGIAVGSFTANQTSYQRRAGIDDSLEAHVADAGRFAPAEIEARNNQTLRRFFLEQTAETLEWLHGMGLCFHGPSPEPPNRVPRMHNVVPGAKAYIASLQARLQRLGGVLRCNAAVTQLLREDDGAAGAAISTNDLPLVSRASRRVLGVTVEHAGESVEYRASHGVVLAAGDYANSPQWISRFKGERFALVEGINPFATGDGHRLAEDVGARLVNMDVTYGPELRFVPPPGPTFQQLLPTHGPALKLLGWLLPRAPRFLVNALIRRLLVTWQHPEHALFEDGAILVNQHGRRFCDERTWPDRELATAAQSGRLGYILLDRRLIERYNAWPHFVSTAPKIAYAYVADYLRLRPDVAIRAAALETIATIRGISPAALQQTVDQVNSERQQQGSPLLCGDDWVLLGPAKAYFTTTEGGAQINEQFQVLDCRGIPIPGLYAVGQNGLGGQILWGHGLHIAWAITSGRLCGKALAGADRQVGQTVRMSSE